MAQGKTMAEHEETQQEKETRWTAQRAAHDRQQQEYRGGEDTENRQKLVDRGSHSDYRCGDGCGHSSVKSGWCVAYEAMREGFGISMHRPLAGHTPLRRCGKNPSARRCSHGSCGVVEGEVERPPSGVCAA